MTGGASFVEGRVIVKIGDITREDAEAIVNAANSTLMGGGGVDGAIHRAGGPDILAACKEIRRSSHPDGLPPGQAVITTGGRLTAKYVIHTVGPVWRGGSSGEPEKLAQCYRNSLTLAASHNITTIAFPAISTGVYGYPKDLAAQISSREINDWLTHNATPHQVRLVFFAATDMDLFIANCVWR
ncbi:MAG TPA: O-acetyl-ADP-ribose deacetylase [Candidatus Brocadiia bacterium]|nr:O-acetyl-ADP-ribose deacetylase [Candidatus Brocadiia bacterium]